MFGLDIITYKSEYKEQVISLILNIQNNEAHINLPLCEQPDLSNIEHCYRDKGGEFWIAVENGKVIGTIGFMACENNCGILKKFFVKSAYRSQKIGLSLYLKLIEFAKSKGIKHIILDTPSVAKVSHKFYEKAGFYKISKEDLPIEYNYVDRNSILYILNL
ncbi:MAG: GNAT family N-acetyltransferase [Lachnospirales bacterium]